MILFDTTVLVYAVGSEHALRSASLGVLTLVRDGEVRGTTTFGVIQEFAHVRARRRSRSDAVALARDFVNGFAPLARPEVDDLLEGLELFRRSRVLGAFDAVLAVTARRRGWALASADRAFRHVRGLHHLDPASPAFVEEARAAG